MKALLIALSLLALAGCTTTKSVTELVPAGMTVPVAKPTGPLPRIASSGTVPAACAARDRKIADSFGALYMRMVAFDKALTACNSKLIGVGNQPIKVKKY